MPPALLAHHGDFPVRQAEGSRASAPRGFERFNGFRRNFVARHQPGAARRGQGVGTALLRLALAYARDILGMERATLRVFDHNAAAMACYRRVGFQAVSLERGCFLHGAERWDCWSMEALL